MDYFEEPYWNYYQLLSWVYLRDRPLVCEFSDRKGPGTRPNIMMIKPGESSPRPIPYDNCNDAEEAIHRALVEGRPVATGLANDNGDSTAVPKRDWCDLKICFGPFPEFAPIAQPTDVFRQGATHWHNLKFERSEILAVWADASAKEPCINEPADKVSALTRDAAREGGSRRKYDLGLQTAVDRIRDDLTNAERRLTLSSLKGWLRDHGTYEEPYEFPEMIPGCDELYISGTKLVWKDRDGRERERALKSMERYISRSNAAL